MCAHVHVPMYVAPINTSTYDAARQQLVVLELRQRGIGAREHHEHQNHKHARQLRQRRLHHEAHQIRQARARQVDAAVERIQPPERHAHWRHQRVEAHREEQACQRDGDQVGKALAQVVRLGLQLGTHLAHARKVSDMQ